MSRYLVDRVEHIENVVIHRRATVSAVEGNGHLTGISVRNGSGQETRLNTPALFMFIGADPNTSWLSGCIELDAKGFVLTGPAASARDRRERAVEGDRPDAVPARNELAGRVRSRRRPQRFGQALRVGGGRGAIAVSFVHQHIGKAI